MKTTTWILIAAVLACVVAGVGAAVALAPGEPVDVVSADRGPIQQFIDERAVTRLPRTYLISMPYAARIEEITLREGDRVEKDNPDKPLVKMVPEDLELAVAEAEAAVERLDATIAENMSKDMEELAMRQSYEVVRSMRDTIKAAETRVESGTEKKAYNKRRFDRLDQAYKSGAITDEEHDRVYLDYVTAGFDLAQDELVLRITKALTVAVEIFPEMINQMVKDKSLADAVLKKQRAEAAAVLEQVKLRRQRGTIVSPVDGVVLHRYVTDERFLGAGEPLLEIGRLEDLEIEVDLLSVDVVDAKVGDRVEIYGPAVGAVPAKGRVAKVYPAGFTKISSLGVEQQRVKVIVAVEPEDLKRLAEERRVQVGYRVRVKIVTDERDNVLVVPRSSLFRGAGKQWQLFVAAGNRARLRTVEVGLMNDRLAEIISGLEAGERVIRTPPSNLTDGGKVAARLARE
ncbi:MAG: HlyD family efflux transporter periplasmic adaptor subunit [Planctomycetaceae bacterium]|nr:HlyD family efflux transporter periplasmic adaptor subunit [Planctomycetaceae bacterium]